MFSLNSKHEITVNLSLPLVSYLHRNKGRINLMVFAPDLLYDKDFASDYFKIIPTTCFYNEDLSVTRVCFKNDKSLI